MNNIEIVVLLALSALLFYGAHCDLKSRIIPNAVPIGVGAIGVLCILLGPRFSLLHIPLIERVAGFIILATLLFILANKFGGVGGGDFKLMAAMGLTFGIYQLVPILFVTTLSGVAWAKIKKQKSVPLAAFVFVGFLAYLILVFLV